MWKILRVHILDVEFHSGSPKRRALEYDLSCLSSLKDGFLEKQYNCNRWRLMKSTRGISRAAFLLQVCIIYLNASDSGRSRVPVRGERRTVYDVQNNRYSFVEVAPSELVRSEGDEIVQPWTRPPKPNRPKSAFLDPGTQTMVYADAVLEPPGAQETPGAQENQISEAVQERLSFRNPPALQRLPRLSSYTRRLENYPPPQRLSLSQRLVVAAHHFCYCFTRLTDSDSEGDLGSSPAKLELEETSSHDSAPYSDGKERETNL